MMPLWLELLLTPMAAPETRWLRAMRLTLLVGSVAVAAGVLNLSSITRAFGRVGTGMLAGLCASLAILVALYAWTKTRADAAHLDRLAGGDR